MEEINEFQRKLLLRGLFACICPFIVLFVVVILLIFRTPHPEIPQQLSKQQLRLSQQLNSVETHLNDVSAQIKQSKAVKPDEIEALSQQLNVIQNQMVNISKQADLKTIQNSIENAHQDIVSKLQVLQKNFQQIKQQLSPSNYLSITNLPFKVTSIDIWNGEPEATIMLDGSSALMAKQDTYSGWTLTEVSFDLAHAIFINKNKQLVKVTF